MMPKLGAWVLAQVSRVASWAGTIVGLAMVSNDSKYVEGALSKLVDFVRMVPQINLIDYQIDLL